MLIFIVVCADAGAMAAEASRNDAPIVASRVFADMGPPGDWSRAGSTLPLIHGRREILENATDRCIVGGRRVTRPGVPCTHHARSERSRAARDHPAGGIASH